MARRGGKAASRRSRQRRQQRAAQAPPPSGGTRPVAEEALAEPMPAASPDAFEKADAELRASTPPPGSRAAAASRTTSQPSRARTTDFSTSSGPSRLNERAAAEYHYVLQDLRNIGVLVLVIGALLAVATFAVNVLNVGPF